MDQTITIRASEREAFEKQLVARGIGITQEAPTPTQTDFEPLTPLDDEYCATPFPTDALPAWIADYVKAAAASAQVPEDMAASGALGALATVTRGNIRVRVTPDYTEPCVLWLLQVANSGDRKSQNQRLMLAPAYEAEKTANEDLTTVIANDAARVKTLEAAVERAERAVTKGGTPDEQRIAEAEYLDAATALAEFRPTREVRLLADDVTPEALGRLLYDNKETIAIASTEGNLFGIVTGRCSDKPLIEVFLKAHNEDPTKVDRIGRDPLPLEAPRLTMVIATQPAVLQEIGQNKSLRGNGFVARFLTTYPKPKVGSRTYLSPAINEVVRDDYYRGMDALARPCIAMTGRHELTVSDAALQVLVAMNNALEPRIGPYGDLAHMADWCGKLLGAVNRIAGLLHVARHGLTGTRVIDSVTMGNAALIGEYFLAHAITAHSVMMGKNNAKDAQQVLASMQRQEKTQFTVSDVKRSSKWDDSRTDAALETLRLHGYIRAMAQIEYHKGTGRPPSQMYEVRPDLPRLS